MKTKRQIERMRWTMWILLFCFIIVGMLCLVGCAETPNNNSPQKLNAPALSIQGNIVSWDANTNAEKFEISLDGNLSYVENTVTSKTLSDGQTIKIRAIGNGIDYTTSDWSDAITYNKQNEKDPTQTIKLDMPVVTVSSEGLASWSAVADANGYFYKINGGTEKKTEKTTVQLSDGESITVKAAGDNVTYTDSDWSVSVTYNKQDSDQTTHLVKLAAPVVTVSTEGLASWSAVADANGYFYKINGGTEKKTEKTTVQLSDGESITVKAAGDNVTYTDSDWSLTKIYSKGSFSEGNPPVFLGIIASNDEPNQSDDIPVVLMSKKNLRRKSGQNDRREFGVALTEHFSDSRNYFGEIYPVASNYSVYSSAGEIVYIQIWLNNPDQYTILSLKLNGTKYQVGGGLSSFFVTENSNLYNCVYVAVTIPSDVYIEKEYRVSEIEYIANKFINDDGTDAFMSDNDKIKIGLTYNTTGFSVDRFTSTSLTINGASASFVLNDENNVLSLSGAWCGVAVYDGYNIIQNQQISVGQNNVTVSGLEENTGYYVIAYVFGDAHDGNGVKTHIIYNTTFTTPSVIEINTIANKVLYNEEKNGYYNVIEIDTTLNSQTASYIKAEVIDKNTGDIVYTNNEYNGYSVIDQGLKENGDYAVKVYYKDSEYPNGKYIEEHVFVQSLGKCFFSDKHSYDFTDDAIITFHYDNNDNNYAIVNSFTLYMYDKHSARYVAEDVLYMLTDEYQTFRQEYQAAQNNYEQDCRTLDRTNSDAVARNNELYRIVNEYQQRASKYESAQWAVENRFDNNWDEAFWREEYAKGKYYYTLTYGMQNAEIRRNGSTYYAVLENVFANGVTRYDCILVANIEGKEEEVVENNLYFDVNNTFIELNNVEVDDATLDGNVLTYNLHNNDYSAYGDENRYRKAYIYKICVDDGKGGCIVLFENESVPFRDLDTAAWKEEFMQKFLSGESVEGLYDKYVPKYVYNSTLLLDIAAIPAGRINSKVLFRNFDLTYTDDEFSYDYTIEVEVIKKHPTPTLQIENHCAFIIAEASYDGEFEIEAKNKNNETIELSLHADKIVFANVGDKVRVRTVNYESWLASDWTEWTVFEGEKVNAPTMNYVESRYAAVITTDFSNTISGFIYTINGGEEIAIGYEGVIELSYNDVLRVKSVAITGSYYVDSDWTAYTCTDDRVRLATPANLTEQNGILQWNAVENATYYRVWIHDKYNNESTEREWGCSHVMKIGSTYKVRAISEDPNVKPSFWSAEYTYVLTSLNNPSFVTVDSGSIFWSEISEAEGYNVKVNENGTLEQMRDTAFALSELTLGDKLYVQAYKGDITSDWVMIYHYTITLSTPVVTVSYGVASWNAVTNAEKYTYRINEGESAETTETQVNGLKAGDSIVVKAVSTQAGMIDSAWSNVQIQKFVMSAPVLNIDDLQGAGIISWQGMSGVNCYQIEIDGEQNLIYDTTFGYIEYDSAIRVRAVCDNENYEDYGEWSALFTRQDTRERLSTPTIAFNGSAELTILIEDNVSRYVIKCGASGHEINYTPEVVGDTEVALTSFSFSDEDEFVIYVKAIAFDSTTHKDSEWATINFNLE